MDRIKEHPILGASPEGKMVSFTFDGKELEGIEGEPIAAALKAADVMVHRYTKKRHEPSVYGCQDAQGSERRNREAVPALFEIVETAAGI